MEYYKFRAHLKEFCNYKRVPHPSRVARRELHKEYEASLSTAPVEDSIETLGQFLMSTFPLAPLPPAVPAIKVGYTGTSFHGSDFYAAIKEEGKTPMRNYNDAYASASVVASQSDAVIQRDFLLGELANADYPKQRELMKVFNLHVDNTPKTYKEMIDIIKAGTYTIDPKIAKEIDADTADAGNDIGDYHSGPMYGIVWPGPVADCDGYTAAMKEKTKQYAIAKRIIVTGDAAAGLKALQDFEAWLPTPVASA